MPMKKWFFLFLLPLSVLSQTTPKFSKYNIGESGFKIYLPAKPDPATMQYSPDSSKLYTIECIDSSTKNHFHFGAIVVDLNKEIGAVNEELTLAYLDYLKNSIRIHSTAGYGKGQTLTTHITAQGIMDYWKDETGNQWQIVAWYAEHYIVVQFVYGTEETLNVGQWELFKNGIRFPGDR